MTPPANHNSEERKKICSFFEDCLGSDLELKTSEFSLAQIHTL